MHIILASTSVARKMLLNKLGLPFITISPNVDEKPLTNESAEQLVQRLAIAKAQSLSADYNQHWIIGCDQVCVLQCEITGKPHTFERACIQLRRASGNRVIFYCGLALWNANQNKLLHCCERFIVYFRTLSEQEIVAYVNKEQPFTCAGSFKSEGNGICLFYKLEGDDTNTLIGLPLIALNKMLISIGINSLTYPIVC